MSSMTMEMPPLNVGAGQYRDGVTVFPVWTSAPAARGLVTGAAARVTVSERAGSATVGELVLQNADARPALLLDGELLEGGMQHRTLLQDVLLDGRSSAVVPVACVEAGRWDGPAGHGRQARRASVGVRASFDRDESERQGAVWDRVARYAPAFGASPTGSLLDHLDGAGREAQAPLEILPGQRGVVIGVGGRPVVLELFGSTAALRAHLPALLTAARLDAALIPPHYVGPVPSRRARRMVSALTGLPFSHERPRAGAGVAVCARSSYAAVRGLCLDTGPLAHLAVLNTRHPLAAA
jgi:hypothetical protein